MKSLKSALSPLKYATRHPQSTSASESDIACVDRLARSIMSELSRTARSWAPWSQRATERDASEISV